MFCHRRRLFTPVSVRRGADVSSYGSGEARHFLPPRRIYRRDYRRYSSAPSTLFFSCLFFTLRFTEFLAIDEVLSTMIL